MLQTGIILEWSELQPSYIMTLFIQKCLLVKKMKIILLILDCGTQHIQGDGRCAGQWQDISKGHGERSILS
jgi:hypothetical protein